MATDAERITTLEQSHQATQHFQDQAIRHLRELDASTTILLGVVQSQGRDIRLIFERLDSVDKRLDTISATQSDHTAMLAQILARLPEKG